MWTVKELSDALQNKTKDGKRIVVPMFQRGERWKAEQQKTFIDSLIKGYPVGSMLFYEKYVNEQWIYILVDGLQRGNCMRSYMTNPTDFFYDDSIPDELCSRILSLIGKDDEKNYAEVRGILTEFIKAKHALRNIQFYDVAYLLCEKFEADSDSSVISPMIKIFTDFFQKKQDLYEQIASAVIPVIVYNGPEENLPEIFERINSKGTPLDRYEIYAAAWPVDKKFQINNSEIIEYVINKYDALVKDGYTINGYDKEALRRDGKVNAFEYIFGLSHFLVNKYEILGFETKLLADRVNPLAFELVNACLNDSKEKIQSLYEDITALDINAFEKALIAAIEYVSDSISMVTQFKGNQRNDKNRVLHTKYQIISMISFSFREMYPMENVYTVDSSWNEKKKILSKNLVHYYVYDAITDYWDAGVQAKIFKAMKSNRYMNDIPIGSWTVALDGFFEKSMGRSEKSQVSSPKKIEYVLLNCIYMKSFTAKDQLSPDKYDVEHIATKIQMKQLIASCNGNGLPISCIANLCYLPESINRSKGGLNFYQDENYLKYVNLDEVEKKFSFTERKDLEWMDISYKNPEGFAKLKKNYTEFCEKRFKKLKERIFEALGIEIETKEMRWESSGDGGQVVLTTS